jgi:hypothetical protein
MSHVHVPSAVNNTYGWFHHEESAGRPWYVFHLENDFLKCFLISDVIRMDFYHDATEGIDHGITRLSNDHAMKTIVLTRKAVLIIA